MRSCWCKVVALLVLALLMCGCNRPVTTPIETGSDPTAQSQKDASSEEAPRSSIILYELDRETYYQMLKTPSIATVQDYVQSCSYALSSQDGWIEYTRGEQTEVEEYNGIVYHASGVYITPSFIRFAASKERLGKFLNERHIAGSITNTALFYTARMPLILWLQTETEEFFVTVDKATSDAEYVYHVYSTQEIYTQWKSNEGTLVVDGREVSGKVTIHRDYAEIPFLTVVKMLGADVLPCDAESLVIHYGEQQFMLHTKDFSLWQDGKQDTTSWIPPGGFRFCCYENGEMWVDHKSAAQVLPLFSAKLQLDREKNTVVVTADSPVG